ncbi:MAG: cell wall-active antibiotics response protein LiaF [Dehalococcoidia bacterium]|nr:cell wall-active antibiotics response protein LiaF [Dehalococcoidia bacterium]
MRQRGTGALIVAAVLIIVGVIALVDNFGWLDLGWGNLWPVILIVIGLLLIWGQSKVRSLGPQFERVVGDIRLGEQGWDLRNANIDHGIGNVFLDLTKAEIPSGETALSIESWIGNIDILVPADLALSVRGRVTVGSLTLLGHKSDGFLRELDFRSPDYDTAARKVKMALNMVIDDAKVRRAA